MDKTYNSVVEMLKGTGVEQDFANNFKEEVEKRQLSKLLFALRCKANLTQAQMAGKIKCSQSRVSKIENSYDKELCLGDILDYTNALNLNVELSILPQMNVVNKIKQHAFMMKKYADELALLARKDQEMTEGVSKFFQDTIFNFITFISSAAKKVHEPKVSQNNLSVSTSVDLNENCKLGTNTSNHKDSVKPESTEMCAQP